FFYQPEKNVEITAEGETFMTPPILGERNKFTLRDTPVKYITLDNYYFKRDCELIFYPNRAGIKIINDTDNVVTSLQGRKAKSNISVHSGNLLPHPLSQGEEYWTHLEPTTGKDFYYRFEIQLNNVSTLYLVAEQLELGFDEQLCCWVSNLLH
ncbi:MAG: hypothetical protein FWG20_04610, partial [Candidatus Cloacimonetes bacterium]|nr:hypothetical protein [Candidatus Cloacimonadota bacterium]